MYALPGARVRQIHSTGAEVIVEAEPIVSGGHCPACQQFSDARHSRSMRVLADLPACGRPVRVQLTVSRYYCRTRTCPKRTFAEQVPSVTEPHRQRLVRAEMVLAAFSAAVGGQAGARLLGQLGLRVSGSSVLRALRRVAVPARPTPVVVGLDDWAWRRGSRYGSVVVDLSDRRPVDLLADRTAASVKAWLTAHPGVQAIVRDRSSEYARGATQGAPDAVQVLDRWHLLCNIREVAERVVARASGDLTRLGEGVVVHGVPRYQTPAERARRQQARDRAAALYERVQALATAGTSTRGIAKALGIARGTAQKYQVATAAPERARTRYRSQLDPYEAYLQRRWADGCRTGLQLWRELQAQGYQGCSRRVLRWVQLRRTEPAPQTPSRRRSGTETTTAAPADQRPSVPRLAWLLLADHDRLTDTNRDWLARLLAASSAVATAYPLLQALRRTIREQLADQFDPWLAAATSCGVPDLETFAESLQHEHAEVLAALTLPWSTGPVEGQITRLKLIKRQGYGRCSLDTLKRRFLYAA